MFNFLFSFRNFRTLSERMPRTFLTRVSAEEYQKSIQYFIQSDGDETVHIIRYQVKNPQLDYIHRRSRFHSAMFAVAPFLHNYRPTNRREVERILFKKIGIYWYTSGFEIFLSMHFKLYLL